MRMYTREKQEKDIINSGFTLIKIIQGPNKPLTSGENVSSNARVKAYCENVKNIKETSSEEEALSFMEAARDQMKVVIENIGVSGLSVGILGESTA